MFSVYDPIELQLQFRTEGLQHDCMRQEGQQYKYSMYLFTPSCLNRIFSNNSRHILYERIFVQTLELLFDKLYFAPTCIRFFVSNHVYLKQYHKNECLLTLSDMGFFELQKHGGRNGGRGGVVRGAFCPTCAYLTARTKTFFCCS